MTQIRGTTIIGTDSPAIAFHQHFFDQDNKRIVFSGKFGSGKTYFLNDFFKDKTESINTFWLSPIKYSVSQNEDIFEYIKVDIAYHLLKDEHIKPIITKHFGENLYIDQYLKNKPLDVIKILAYGLQSIKDLPSINAKIAASTGTAIEKLVNAYETYKQFKKDLKDKLRSDYDILGDYLKANEEIRGSVFENDLITQTIQVALELCSEVEFETKIKKKDNVLIIDDFDRLDPEHIFRILNIFSVHNDYLGADNKFGFDKIIIVCDIDNIAKIYSHKYGSETDFNGYISKFHSLDIFNFDNNSAIQIFCRTELRNILNDEDAEIVLGLILSYFSARGELTIRNIIKYNFYKPMPDVKLGNFDLYIAPEYKNMHIGYVNNKRFIAEDVTNFYLMASDFPFLQAIKILSVIFGDYKKMISAFEKADSLADMNYRNEYLPNFLKALLPIFKVSNEYNISGNILYGYIKSEHPSRAYVTNPDFNFMGKKLSIITGWTSENMYDGNVSYYKNVNQNLKSIDYLKDTDYKDSNHIKYILKHMKKVFAFMEETGVLTIWGMTN